jgi:hypothetical protein
MYLLWIYFDGFELLQIKLILPVVIWGFDKKVVSLSITCFSHLIKPSIKILIGILIDNKCIQRYLILWEGIYVYNPQIPI